MRLTTILTAFLLVVLAISHGDAAKAKNLLAAHHHEHASHFSPRQAGIQFTGMDLDGLLKGWERALVMEAELKASTDELTDHSGLTEGRSRKRRHALTMSETAIGEKGKRISLFGSGKDQSIISDQVGTNAIVQPIGARWYRYAVLSSAAYAALGLLTFNYNRAVVNALRDKTERLPSVREELKNFKLVKARPDYYAVKDDVNKELIISFRGTNPFCRRDLFNDLMILMNMRPIRWIPAYLFTRWMMFKHPGYAVKLTGHSLGGTLAETVAAALGDNVEAITFNTGQCPITHQSKKFKNMIAFKIDGDLVSRCESKAEKVITFPNNGRNLYLRHTLDSFEQPYIKGDMKETDVIDLSKSVKDLSKSGKDLSKDGKRI